MSRRKIQSVFARGCLVIACLLPFALASAEDLGPGSVAPKLGITKWYKGQPVGKFDDRRIYVVEFWATWCGPCLESIPHVSELARKNPDVTFIGASVLEEDVEDKVAKFVREMGDKMAYKVGYGGNEAGMNRTWLLPAGQTGIPTAFVIKGGIIQWIGHPMSMDKPLSEIKAGTFDLPTFKRRFDINLKKAKVAIATNEAFLNCLQVFDSGKRVEAHARLAGLVQQGRMEASSAVFQRFMWLAVEDPDKWRAEARRLSETGKRADVMFLCRFAIRQAKADEAVKEQARFALDLAILASQGGEYTILNYARQFYRDTADFSKAVELTDKMISALPSSAYKDTPGVLEALQKDRREFLAKVKS